MATHINDAVAYPVIDASLSSEELLALVQGMPAGVFSYRMDSDNRFTFVSQSMLNMLGYTEDEFFEVFDGRFPMMIFGPDRSRAIQALDANVLDGKSTPVRYRIPCKDGHLVWVQDQGRFVKNGQGVADVLVVVVDVTREVEVQQRLQELLDGVPAGLITLRKTGNSILVENINCATQRYLGVNEEQFMGRSATEWYNSFVHPDDHAVVAMLLDELFGPKMEAECIYRVRSAEGMWRWMSYQGRTFSQNDGSLLAYGVHVDRTERQQITERLREQQQIYQAAVDTAQILVWELQPNIGRLTIAESPYAAEFTKRLGIPMIIENMPDGLVPFLDELSVKQLYAMFDAVAHGGVIDEVVLRSVAQPGAPSLSFRVTSVPIYDNTGDPIKVCGTAQDVTKQWIAIDEYHRELAHFNAEHGSDLIAKLRANLTRNEVVDFTRTAPEAVEAKWEMSFDELCAAYTESASSPKERAELRELFDSNRLVRAYGEGQMSFTREFRRSRGDLTAVWVMLQLRLFQHPETGDIECFIYSYNHTEQHLEGQMVQRMAELGYDYMGLINAESQQFTLFRSGDTIEGDSTLEMPYSEASDFVQIGVPDDELEEGTHKAELETVISELEKSGRYEFTYSMVDGEGRIRRKLNQYLFLDESHCNIFFVQSDITEQHEAEQERIRQLDDEQRAHRRTSDLLQNILNTTPTAIFWKDTNLHFQGANKAFLRFVGLDSSEKLIGHTLEDLGLPILYEDYTMGEQRIIDEGISTIRVPGVYAPSDGPVRSVAISKSPFVQDGRIVGLVGSLEDVTNEVEHVHEIRRLNTDLQVALAEAEHAAQTEQNFLSNMSHDMRTPLNGIVGFTRMALATDDEAKRQEYLEKIDYSGKLLLAMVNDVLDMSKITSGRMELLPQAVYAKDLFDATIDMIRPMAQDKGIDLQANIKLDSNVCFEIDKLRVQQVFINIMGNAVNYTKPGGHVHCDFQILDNPVQGCNTLTVIGDDGIGMSREFQKHMFDPFTEENRRAESSGMQGTGLGLSIVKQTVDLMGGFIEVESTINVGSTFSIYLPMPLIEPDARPTKDHMPISGSMEGRHVMVFEDNDLNAEISRAILSDYGVSTYRVHDGQEGFEAFKASAVGEFDALIVDMRMPKMGGLEATRAIRALKRSDAVTVPIIAMTADAFADDVQACLEAGMDAHISKPIDPTELMGELSRLWG